MKKPEERSVTNLSTLKQMLWKDNEEMRLLERVSIMEEIKAKTKVISGLTPKLLIVVAKQAIRT
ncbi:secretion protein HlyD [Sesbania bispinosa]|nr:secretion protein HlyD [Sesbania bispinosa]